MPSLTISPALFTIAIILLLTSPAHAFGAGNIASVAKIEGLNWRHGDIEDTLLTLVMSRAAGGKKFDKMNVARVYFGNWLRDYSQAIDVGTVKYVSAEAIRILLWVLGFMTFGFGTKEFEVTSERLGCYRPEDHIDNPKDYADNLDATQYDRRLRGPVNERVELAIDPRTGLKNYIANEQAGIMTSAQHVRNLFGRSIQLGRSYARSKNKAELYEALRLLGTGLHCLEDYSAHSNYTELALIELGERDVFPHVGRQTAIRLQGVQNPVYPVITGTFGGVDFLHSVMGEFSDKATQSEIQELEGTMQNDSRADTSVLKDLLDKIPSGLFGGKDEAGKAEELQSNATAAQMSQMRVSPRNPEAWTKQMQEIVRQIYPIIEWHDEIMLSITETIEQIPILPDLIEQLEGEINKFVFSLLAPFVLPIISQIKTELNTGSSEIIQSSKDKQLIVFHDDYSSDPTHSMLSKDHFSNVLNEPAGKIASQVLKWVVPQLIACWDDESVDPNRTITRIIGGVFHHPAQRNMGEDGAIDGRRLMFGVVEQWWQSKDRREQQGLQRQLSRDGVMNGENHKEGVHDSGHGCGKPLGMHTTAPKGSAAGGLAAGALMGGLSSALGGGSGSGGFGGGNLGGYGGQHNEQIGNFASEAAGGGALGGLVGALAGGVGGGLLSGAFGGGDEKKTKRTSQGYTADGGYKQEYTEVAHSGSQYGQAQYSETSYPSGGRETEYQRYQQSGNQGAGFEQHTETRPTYGGGYEQTNERIYERPGQGIETETWREGRDSEGRSYEEKHRREKKERRNSSEDSEDSNGYRKNREKKERKKKHDSEDERERHGYGGGYGEYKREKSRSREREQRHEYGGGGYGEHRREKSRSRSRERGGYGGGYGEREHKREKSRSRERGQHHGGGYEAPRQEYGNVPGQYGGNEGYQAPRQEYGGGGYGGGYEAPRQEFGGGGYGGGYEAPRQEYGGGYGGGYEAPRQEYGGGGYEQPRQEYGDVPGAFGGNEAGWGERDNDEVGDDYSERRY